MGCIFAEKSGLPGPRGNIELAQVVADEGNRELFERYTAYTADQAPVNSPYEFLAFCGVVGLGQLLAEGDGNLLKTLRTHASDPRWRVPARRWRWHFSDLVIRTWMRCLRGCRNGAKEHRSSSAAAAALCEPRLLGHARQARAVLQILDGITATLQYSDTHPREDMLVLRKGLGYCWSVAVAALPDEGKSFMEKWLATTNKDIQWIMQVNLRKARLARMDQEWVKKWQIRR